MQNVRSADEWWQQASNSSNAWVLLYEYLNQQQQWTNVQQMYESTAISGEKVLEECIRRRRNEKGRAGEVAAMWEALHYAYQLLRRTYGRTWHL